MDRRYGFGWLAAVLIACVGIAGCGGGSGTAKLMLTTTSLPDGTVNTPYYFLLQPTGGTPPYTWSQASGGAMPPGITFSNAGAFNGTPTTAGSYGPYTIKVTDANSNTATSAGLSIKVSASTLSITTTSLPDGSIGAPYSGTLAATGGKAPYSWSQLSGGALPPGLTTASGSGVITGTPTTAGTYGPYVFTVTDENSTTATSGPLTIVIGGTATAVCTPMGNEGALASTSYAFLVKGTDKSGNPLDIAGSFAPDGQGGILSAVADYNGTTDGPQQLQVNLAASSYSFSTSAQGCLYLAFSGLASSSSVRKGSVDPAYLAPGDVARARKVAKPAIVAVPVSSVQFSFYLTGMSNNSYPTGRIIESDTTASGTNAAGMIHVQDTSVFSLGLSGLQANYAFGVDGWTTTASGILRTAVAGAFTNTTGTLSAGFADVNANGAVSGEINTGYGLLNSMDPTTGRGTGSYFLSWPTQNGTQRLTYDFAFYVLNASDFLLISIDNTQSTSTTPLLAGRALASTTNYAAAPLNGYYLLASQGYQSLGTNIGNIAQIGTLNATNAGAIPTATIYSNYAGTSTTAQYPGSSYSVEAASGRTSLAGVLTNSPVVYLTNTTPDDGIVGFLVGTDNQASSGVLVNQTASTPNYSVASISLAYPAGTAEDVDGKNGSFLGDFSFTGTGAYTLAAPQTTGTLTNVPSQGSIAINADGSGNLDGGNFPLVTNGQVIYAISNSGDPLLFVFEEGTLP
ncbi:MAG TPA: Ig domain-containing protein [Candidatus Sulfotelmatobacter sp.]|nr:Ig domain-containing protein [Candidatus Sulfotelmatobacter sp.]